MPKHGKRAVCGADYLLATEYVVGGHTYDTDEVLDTNSVPEFEKARNQRITVILRSVP